MINVDQRTAQNRLSQLLRRFMGTVENDFLGIHTIVQCFFILKPGDHLRPGSFPVKNAANRIEVISFVGPGHLNLRIA